MSDVQPCENPSWRGMSGVAVGSRRCCIDPSRFTPIHPRTIYLRRHDIHAGTLELSAPTGSAGTYRQAVCRRQYRGSGVELRFHRTEPFYETVSGAFWSPAHDLPAERCLV